jgi:hypothetical protein
MRDPPVSRRFPRRARLSACFLRVADIKAPANRTSWPCRRPDSRPPPRHTRRQPPLSEVAPHCPLPTTRVRARHATDADRPLPPPPIQSPLSRACPSVVHASPSTLPSPTPPGKPWCRRLRRATVYTASSAAPPSMLCWGPTVPFPAPPPVRRCRATTEHACHATRTLASGQAGPGRGPRAHCAGRGQVGPSWAARTPCKRATPVLCNWAAADSAQW